MRDFLDLAELSREQVEALTALAARLESHPAPEALKGKVLGLVFLNPSLRTLASFQSGMARLGGTSFVISPQASWKLEHREGVVMDGDAAEHIKEAIPVLAGYSDALGVRAFAEGRDLNAHVDERLFKLMHALCPVPMINLESAMNHPCQALADWKTLNDLNIPSRGKFVLSWANHPRALPLAVPTAVAHMAAMRGMQVCVLRPEGFGLPSAVLKKAQRAAALSGGSIEETDDPEEALHGAHVLYAKSWGATSAYGDAGADAELRKGLKDWRVEEHWFGPAEADCRFMHCLPVRRGVVVADEVLDGPRSIVQRQARNRLFAQMAVLYRLLGEVPEC